MSLSRRAGRPADIDIADGCVLAGRDVLRTAGRALRPLTRQRPPSAAWTIRHHPRGRSAPAEHTRLSTIGAEGSIDRVEPHHHSPATLIRERAGTGMDPAEGDAKERERRYWLQSPLVADVRRCAACPIDAAPESRRYRESSSFDIDPATAAGCRFPWESTRNLAFFNGTKFLSSGFVIRNETTKRHARFPAETLVDLPVADNPITVGETSRP